MPAIKLLLSGSKLDYNVKSIVKDLTELTCTTLEKNQSETMIFIQFIPRDLWFIQSKSLEELGKNSFKVDITITDETCTKDQKSSYIRDVFKLFSIYINHLHHHSNIHIIDCRGSSYGYHGKTQDALFYEQRN